MFVSFFKIKLFYWSLVDLQCCDNFCCIAKWFGYTNIYILFHSLFHYSLSLTDIEDRCMFVSLTQPLGVCVYKFFYSFIKPTLFFFFFEEKGDPSGTSHLTLCTKVHRMQPLQNKSSLWVWEWLYVTGGHDLAFRNLVAARWEMASFIALAPRLLSGFPLSDSPTPAISNRQPLKAPCHTDFFTCLSWET